MRCCPRGASRCLPHRRIAQFAAYRGHRCALRIATCRLYSFFSFVEELPLADGGTPPLPSMFIFFPELFQCCCNTMIYKPIVCNV